MTNKNLRYIADVLKSVAPRFRPNWWETLGFLQCHKIAGMFYCKAKKMQLPMPEKAERILKSIFDSQMRRVRYMRNYVRESAEALFRKGIPHAFLKGSVLCNVTFGGKEIYADGERISNDMDILTAPNDLDSVVAVLKELGYVQGRYDRENDTVVPFSRMEILRRRMNRGEVAPFVKRTGNAEVPFIEVDLNFSLGNTPNDGADLLKEMISTAKRNSGKIDLVTLTPEMFFLHLIMHQYKESCLYFTVERGKDLDIYKLADLFYLFDSQATDILRVVQTASAFGVEKRVGAVLRQVGELFADDNILKTAELCGNEQPSVTDYGSKKEYIWQRGIEERLCAFDSIRYLREV